MSEPSIDRPWSRRQWAATLAVVTGVQFGLLSWLSARAPLEPRVADPRPELTAPAHLCEEVLALTDPTLFSLGGPKGFSGRAWMQEPPRPTENPDWSEPPRWLAIQTNQLASTFLDYADRNRAPVQELAVKPLPRLTAPSSGRPAPRLPHSSSMTIEGDLAQRRLMTAMDLPSWPFGDVLTSSVVQVLVDTRGLVISAALLSGSGLADADRQALAQARRARFATASGAGATSDEITLGRMVFQWHALPPLATNASPSLP